jgi:hypothetical protein
MRVGDTPYVIVMTVLWVSGIVSGFLDNIPFTITMIPIVRLMLESNIIPNNILWWALSLGACLGGNLTMIGASANVVSLCHLPVYLFANTLKFSHRPSSQQRIHRKVESKTHGDISYQLITHSHDTVDLKHVDFLVTEDGIKDKAAIAAWIQSSPGNLEKSLSTENNHPMRQS